MPRGPDDAFLEGVMGRAAVLERVERRSAAGMAAIRAAGATPCRGCRSFGQAHRAGCALMVYMRGWAEQQERDERASEGDDDA